MAKASAGGGQTRRQRIIELLRHEELGFEALRSRLQVSVRQLEDDLRHVARSVRGGASGEFRTTPARCAACGFVFRSREQRRFHPPSRCPRCRRNWIEEPRYRIEGPQD